jgi:hypothetical protein
LPLKESRNLLDKCDKILSMPTEQILDLLIAERDKLNRAIEVLQGSTKRRGRPPKSVLSVIPASPEPAQPAKKKRRKFTAVQRKQQAERMKAFWAAKKKAEAKPQSKAASKPKAGKPKKTATAA